MCNIYSNMAKSSESIDLMQLSTNGNYGSLLVDGVSREFVWGCELTKDKPSAIWPPQEVDEDDERDYLRHTLFIKQAILGASAVKNEKNIVAVETHNYYKQNIKQPIISLTSGISDSCILDLNFAGDLPLKFTLTSGSGPLFITAAHLVECPNDSYDEGDTELGNDTELIESVELVERKDGDDSTVRNQISVISKKQEKQVVIPKPVEAVQQSEAKTKKRKAHQPEKQNSKKRGKLEEKALFGNDDSDDDDCKYESVKHVDAGESSSSSSDSSEEDEAGEDKEMEADDGDDDEDDDDDDEDDEEEDESEESASSPEKPVVSKSKTKAMTKKSRDKKITSQNDKAKKPVTPTVTVVNKLTPRSVTNSSKKSKKA